MNPHHKRNIKRKVNRQLNRGRNYNMWKHKIKTIIYKWPSLGLASEIVGIQPMTGPVGPVFQLTIDYSKL